jgi:hypothetical protein
VFLPVLLSLVGPPSLLQRRKGWVSFFSAVDEGGVDEEVWNAGPEGDSSKQRPQPPSHVLVQPSAPQPSVSPTSPAANYGTDDSTVITHVHQEAEFQAYAPFK